MFAFNALGVVLKLTPNVRSDDFGVTVDSGVISTGIIIKGADVTFWGVPSDPVHDPQRYGPMFGGAFYAPGASTEFPRKAFTSTPTSCPGTPEVRTGRLDGWKSVGQFAPISFSSRLRRRSVHRHRLRPAALQPHDRSAAHDQPRRLPSGLDVKLHAPQNTDPDGLATAHLTNASR